jgi:hypothetical protein
MKLEDVTTEQQAAEVIADLLKQNDSNFEFIKNLAKKFDIFDVSYNLPTQYGELYITLTDEWTEEGDLVWYSSFDGY